MLARLKTGKEGLIKARANEGNDLHEGYLRGKRQAEYNTGDRNKKSDPHKKKNG